MLMFSPKASLRAKALIIFGVCYALSLAAGVLLAIAGLRLGDWDASYQKTTQNIGFLVNMAAFGLAMIVALSRRPHGWMGGCLGHFGFHSVMVEIRLSLAAGFALLAMLVDVCAYTIASRFFTGELAIPSLARLGVLTAVYAVLAWSVVSENIARKARDLAS